MTAREYLRQIRALDTKIQQKKEQVEGLKAAAEGASAIRYDKDKVQTSPTGDRTQNIILSYTELEKEIEEQKLLLQNIRHTIIDQIQLLDDDRYVNVLYKRYVQYKSYELIAVEMHYSFDYVKEIHRHALTAFYFKFPTLSHPPI